MKALDQLLTNLANLITVKAIITLVIVFIFCFKIFSGMEIGNDFLVIFAGVMTYWLCERSKRKEEE